jgi:FkbM family methyltransferase
MIKELSDIYRKFSDKKSRELWQLAVYARLKEQYACFFKYLIERETLKEKRVWEHKQDLILFGCGRLSEFCLNYFKNSVSNVKILGFSDNHFKEKRHLGLKFFPLKELKKIKDKVVMIATINEEFIKQIREQLLTYGFKAEQILDYGYLTGDKRVLKYVDNFNAQYFDKGIVHPRADEIFIDCGASIGDSIEKFIKFSNGKFEKIVAFEPGEIRFKQLKHNTMLYKNKIQYINAGSHSCKKTFFCEYYVENGLKFCEKETELKVKTDSIDNVLKGKKATFIKMDIEGAELEALKGAKNTIIKYKPTLAISVYHKLSDLVDIPAYISELVPGYKFYLRCYDFRGFEIVLYAV